jgi:hypothetical protein
MLQHRRCLSSLAVAALPLIVSIPAHAFDERAFCVAARQIALAENKDKGVWIDRTTRNDGMTVSCQSRTVLFHRFFNTHSAAMDEPWQRSKAEEWSAAHCSNPIWAEAIQSGWMIGAAYVAGDGVRVSVWARCK